MCQVGWAGEFFTGADISLLPFMEQRGAVYRDNGQAAPLECILVNHGDNMFRLRLFVNPDPNYESTFGAIQDLNYTLSLAQRLHATGAKFLLDLHYSDTWADWQNQTTPSSWSGQNLTTLSRTVHDYTLNTINAFKAQGVMPDMVQVGNEITNGMLWNTGKITNKTQSWQKLGTLLNSAISGVRDAQSPGQHVNVAVHIHSGNTPGLPQDYFSNLTNLANVTDYETIGLSYYPTPDESLSDLRSNLDDLATTYNKKLMIMETNYQWEGSSGTGPWQVSPQGQAQFMTDLIAMMKSLPNDRGEGVLWWAPETIQLPGTFVWGNGTATWFDQNGNALPVLDTLVPEPSAAALLGLMMLALCRRQRRDH